MSDNSEKKIELKIKSKLEQKKKKKTFASCVLTDISISDSSKISSLNNLSKTSSRVQIPAIWTSGGMGRSDFNACSTLKGESVMTQICDLPVWNKFKTDNKSLCLLTTSGVLKPKLETLLLSLMKKRRFQFFVYGCD